MAKYKRRNRTKTIIKNSTIYLLLIFVVILALGIGYAQVSDVTLNVNGTASATPQQDIFITNIAYVSNNNANPSLSNISDPNLTVMTSSIELGNTLDSTITYQISIKNNKGAPATYQDAIYLSGIGYDNNDIEFILNGISPNDVLNDGETKQFTITFKYVDNLSTITNNVLNSVINFKFEESNKVAKIGNNLYDTLQEAVNNVTTDSTPTTIILLKDTSEKVTTKNNQIITLNLNNHTLSNISSNGNNCIVNYANLTITGGNVRSSSGTDGAINNESSGVLTINDGRIELTASNGKQAIYNNKGRLNIGGSVYIASAGSQRAAVQNVSGGTVNISGGTIMSTGNSGFINVGTANITGGTIKSTAQYAISNTGGTLIIGSKDGTVDRTTPLLQSVQAGLNLSGGTIKLYDGIIKSKTNPINNPSRIQDKETSYDIVASTETIDGQNYNLRYLAPTHYTVTFNANTGTVTEASRYVDTGHPIGDLPIPTKNGWIFDGWFTLSTGGTEVTRDTIIDADQTIFAHWHTDTFVAQIGNTTYATLQEAINAVANNTETTITILENTSEKLTVNATKNIIFDFNGHTITNSGKNPVLENNGTITITNATFTSSAEQGILNNKAGTMTINNSTFIATGDRQVLYITGGVVNISGNTFMTSKATSNSVDTTMDRGTIQVLSGTLNITGGTIECTTQHGITNEGTVNIGLKDGSISTTSPVIIGNMHGIKSTGTVNFYDGIIKGKIDAMDGTTVADLETNSQIVNGSETINNETYQTAYLEITP